MTKAVRDTSILKKHLRLARSNTSDQSLRTFRSKSISPGMLATALHAHGTYDIGSGTQVKAEFGADRHNVTVKFGHQLAQRYAGENHLEMKFSWAEFNSILQETFGYQMLSWGQQEVFGQQLAKCYNPKQKVGRPVELSAAYGSGGSYALM